MPKQAKINKVLGHSYQAMEISARFIVCFLVIRAHSAPFVFRHAIRHWYLCRGQKWGHKGNISVENPVWNRLGIASWDAVDPVGEKQDGWTSLIIEFFTDYRINVCTSLITTETQGVLPWIGKLIIGTGREGWLSNKLSLMECIILSGVYYGCALSYISG